MRLLAKDPATRPASAGDVARALRSPGEPAPLAPLPAPPSDADRLVDDGLKAISTVSAPVGRRAPTSIRPKCISSER